jgi:hypothetical protein
MLGSNYYAMALIDNVASVERKVIKLEGIPKLKAHDIVTSNIRLDKIFEKKFGLSGVADWDKKVNDM